MRATVQWGVLHGLTHAVDVLRKSTGLPCAAVQMGPVTIGTLMCAHKEAIMEEQSWRRNHGGAIMEENHGGAIMEETSGEHLGGIWEASGRHLGGIWEALGSRLGEFEAEEASGRHLEAKSQKSQPLCNGMQKLLKFVNFTKCFWGVGVIKCCKFQNKMMPGSVCVLPPDPWAL